ncbi:MAG: PEP-CTERM sorting domain-containing protein [Gemmatimonadaceae bacterium]
MAPTTDSFTSITFTEVGNAAVERWDAFGTDDIIYGARSAPTVTPEPSSYALMFAGLGAIAAAVRRRKRNA